MRVVGSVCAVVIGAVAAAHAQPDEPSRDAVDAAPPPGAESGRVDTPVSEDTAARKVGRTVLFVPKAVVEVGSAPIRASLSANERYHLVPRFRRLFFNEAGTLGVYPVFQYDSGDRVLFGAQLYTEPTPESRFKVFGGFGLAERRKVRISYRTDGKLDGRVGFAAYGEYDLRPESRFYGFGNEDEADVRMTSVDAFTADEAVLAFYRDRLARLSLVGDIGILDGLFTRLSASAADRKRDESSRGRPIDQIFMPSSLISFDEYKIAYGEIDLRHDSRGALSSWQSEHLTSRGTLASLYLGRATLDPGPAFWRYGVDLQHFIPLGEGPRTLSARFHGEATSAEVDEVPFDELPALGGNTWLRGYNYGRFRDRVAAVATAEYQWDLSRMLYASVFLDVGRVFPSLDDLTLDDMRFGYGLAIEGYSDRSLAARVSIASSGDGGVFFYLYLDPISEIPTRVRRR